MTIIILQATLGYNVIRNHFTNSVIPTSGRNLESRLLLSKKISPDGRNDSLLTLKQLEITYSKV
jgi:hypothetical protein